MYKLHPYSPYPIDMRYNSNLTTCNEQISEDGSYSKYVVIYAKPFLNEKNSERIESGVFTMEELFSHELELLGRPPRPCAPWFYHVNSFIVDREHHSDYVTFSDNQRVFQQWGFDEFNELVEFCREKFSLDIKNFCPPSDTNWPEW